MWGIFLMSGSLGRTQATVGGESLGWKFLGSISVLLYLPNSVTL